MNSHGRTIDEARQILQKLALLVFDEERLSAREMTAGREVMRELFFIPIPSL